MRGLALVLLAACGSPGSTPPEDVGGSGDAAVDGANATSARDRLLQSYLAWLTAHPGPTTNGLDGAALGSVCQLWAQLQPSAQAVFLTLTARLDASHLRRDDSSMLDHVTKLYWLTGGGGATMTDPGMCGGSGNRMIMQIDATLHADLRTAFSSQGGPSAARTIGDAITSSFWRDSHDLGGSHAPFDESDETEGGAPRGQVQYFKDPASAIATAPLGRPDLMTLVDPFALEMDHDFDCAHNSNPSCSYTLYGPLCAPRPNLPGVEIFAATYGAVDLAWKPTGC